jgi:uncharacterized protein (DUF1697 family)
MSVFVALLRAVNVGGTGMLAMRNLRTLCEQAGFQNVATYIQSGNVVFKCEMTADKAKQRLEAALQKKLGQPMRVFLRTPKELEEILKRNPFTEAAPNQLVVVLLDGAAPRNTLAGFRSAGREEVKMSGREVFVHYPDGIGRSKLKLPFADQGTARNLNTVRRLHELAVTASKQSGKGGHPAHGSSQE